MNIGFDAKRSLFNRSGLGNYSRSTITLLSKFYPQNKFFLFASKKNESLFQISENQILIEPKSGFYRLFSTLWRSWGIYKQIKSQNIDLYHGLSNELPIRIRKASVKSVVTIHDLIFLRYPEYYSFFDRWIYTQKFKHACRVADKIIATSEATKKDIISFFGIESSRIEVVYQTCDAIFRLPVSVTKKKEIIRKYDLPEKYVLYLGTIEKRKNALSLIKAYLAENIQTPLLIAGKPTAYLDEIKAYLIKHPDEDRIYFRHSIETQDLPALYQASSLFVYPSVFEGFGIPILEALCSGVPVITSTGSCFSETGGDAAIYCDPCDIDQLGKSISTVLSNETLRKSMIEKGFAQSLKFSDEKVAANLMKVYTGLK